jgi:hypothetical protein
LPFRFPLRRDAYARIKGSILGAPNITEAGVAIGIVACADDQGGGAPQPALVDHLPGWLMRNLGLTDGDRAND